MILFAKRKLRIFLIVSLVLHWPNEVPTLIDWLLFTHLRPFVWKFNIGLLWWLTRMDHLIIRSFHRSRKDSKCSTSESSANILTELDEIRFVFSQFNVYLLFVS